jgi:hypothetical protein
MRNSYFYQEQEYEAWDVKEEPKDHGKQFMRLILKPKFEGNNYLIVSENINKEKKCKSMRMR